VDIKFALPIFITINDWKCWPIDFFSGRIEQYGWDRVETKKFEYALRVHGWATKVDYK
jgi:hypothetical protein